MSRHVHVLAFTLVLATVTVAAAQPKVDITVGQSLDAWTAQGNDSNERRAVLAAAIDQAFADARGRVWATSDLFTYSTPGDWTSLQLASGGSWTLTLSEDRSAIYVGGSGMLRRNGDAWDAANVAAGSAFANIAFTPRPTASVRAGYTIDVRGFDDIASLDHVQQGAFVSGLVNLPSRTTLVGEVILGAKHYAGEDAAGAMRAGGTLQAGTGDPGSAGIATGAPAGNGMGAGGTMGNGQNGAAQSLRPLTTGAAHLAGATGPVTARLVTVFGRVAQSLAIRTSVSLEVMHRATFGELPPAVITTPVELFEDGLYDDPFASDATDVRFTLKHIFANRIEMQLTGAYLDKPFRMTPAYAADGDYRLDGAMRHDRVTRVGVATSIPVAPARTGPWDVALLVRADYVSHASNDAYSQYTSRTLTIGTTVAR